MAGRPTRIWVALLVAVDFGHVSPGAFVAYKAGLAVALGALVTPVIALCAMAGVAARAAYPFPGPAE